MLVLISILLCVFVMCSAILSGSETALFSLSSFTVQEYKTSKDVKKNIISSLLRRPMDLLVTIMMLNVLFNILVQNTVSGLFSNTNNLLLSVGVPLVITLVFGEIFPKSIAMIHNKAIAYRMAPFLQKISNFLGPIRKILTKITFTVSRLLFFFLKKEERVTLDELYSILKQSKKEGIVHTDESDLIEGYLDLRSSIAKELMRPRDEILYYDMEKPLSELVHLFVDQECSKLPICSNDLQEIKGILTIEQYFFCRDQIKDVKDLEKRLKKPFYVPESMNGWALLITLRNHHEDMALVVDEYGSISGLVTQEDLIESVIGEIEDKRDSTSQYTVSGDDVIIASGKLEIDELEDIFSVSFPRTSNVVTIGGWLTEQLGDIPTAGTKYVTDDFLFYVLAAEPNRVRRVYIRKLKHKRKK